MCCRKKNRTKSTQIPEKKKKWSCKSRCFVWICKKVGKCQVWICKKVGKCIKTKAIKTIRLSQITIFGYNLRELLDDILAKKDIATNKKISVKNNISKKILAENKIKLTKANTNDIEQIRRLKLTDLKGKYSITGPKLKVLGDMVQNYKEGNVSMTKIKRKSSQPKQLTKKRLHQIIQNYETAKKKRDIDIIKILQSKKPDVVDVDKFLKDLDLGNIKVPTIFKSKVNLLNDHKGDIFQGGLDLIISKKGRASLKLSAKLREIAGNLKDMRLSEIFLNNPAYTSKEVLEYELKQRKNTSYNAKNKKITLGFLKCLIVSIH